MKGFKRILCSATAAAVAAGSISVYAAEVHAQGDWNGETDTSWYNTTDTEFVLTEPAELAGLAELVNDGTDNFAGKTVKLGGDVCFFEFADAEAWADGVLIPETTWTPIGNTYGTPFKGTFDGCGYAVSGVCVLEYDTVAGFFGYAGSGSCICGLTIESSYIYSDGTYAGGICGYVRVAEIQGCVSSAVVRSEYYIAGGICGVNMGGSILSSYNTGKITGGTAAGGVVGEQCSYGKSKSCFNTGVVSSATSAGGICGRSVDNTIIECYNTGSVSGRKAAGGISGETTGDSELRSCYSSGSITASGTSGGVTGDSGTVCYNCYYVERTADSGCTSSGVSTVNKAALTDGSLAKSLGSGYVQGKDVPVLAWQDTGSQPVVSTDLTTTTTTTSKTTTKTTTTGKTTTTSKTTTSAGAIKIWAVNNDTVLEGAGDTVQLLIDGNVNTPQWATMDSSVAVVDKYGFVTAKGEGTVVIVAMVDGIAAEITLTVGTASTTTTAKTTTVTTTKKTTTTSKTTATGKTTTGKTTTSKTTTKKTTTTSKTTTTKPTTAKTTTTTTTTTAAKAYSLGDCDGNRAVDLSDASEVLRYYACMAASVEVYFNEDERLDMLAFYAADVDRNSQIDLQDAALILQYYARKAAGLEASWDSL